MDKTLFDLQAQLEYRTSNKHIDLYFEEERNAFTVEPLMAIMDYMAECKSKDYTYQKKGSPLTLVRHDLIEIDEWLCDEDNFETIDHILYKMMCLIYTTKGGVTAQALACLLYTSDAADE